MPSCPQHSARIHTRPSSQQRKPTATYRVAAWNEPKRCAGGRALPINCQLRSALLCPAASSGATRGRRKEAPDHSAPTSLAKGALAPTSKMGGDSKKKTKKKRVLAANGATADKRDDDASPPKKPRGARPAPRAHISAHPGPSASQDAPVRKCASTNSQRTRVSPRSRGDRRAWR